MENEIEKQAVGIAESLIPELTTKEQAFFIAGFQEGYKAALSKGNYFPVDAISAEMVKRWFQLFVGIGEDVMKKDIHATLKSLKAKTTT